MGLLRRSHELCRLNDVVLMVIATQVCMRTTSMERPAKVSILDAITHIVVIAVDHTCLVRDTGDVGLRLNATVRGTR